MYHRSHNPVFIPGPTNMPEILRKATDMSTLDHRSEAFHQILQPALDGVRQVIQSKDALIVTFPSSGTGGWEAAITNTLSPNDKILASRHGAFSHRWIDMCQRHGLDVQVIDAPWHGGVPLEQYEALICADKAHEIKAVLVTHNETATGVRSDVAAVRQILDTAKHPALLFVDGVSSIGSMDFRMDEWGVDVAVAGSQKGFMLPAGLTITAWSSRAIAANKEAKLSRCYFNLHEMINNYPAINYPYTPPVGLINGLKLSTELLLEEGLENVFARHKRIASGIRAAVEAWGLSIYAKDPLFRSDTVTAIQVPDNFDSGLIVKHAAQKYGVAFGIGLGDVAGKVFRIGHLGSLSDVLALAGIATAEMAMVDLGLDIKLGSGVAAAQALYASQETIAFKAAA